MIATIGWVVALAGLIGLAGFQLGILAGRPWGRFTLGGQIAEPTPAMRITAAVSILLYAVFALILTSRAGLLPGADAVGIRIATWCLVAFFALSVLVNVFSRSRAERLVMTPASAVLALAALPVALAG